MARKSAGIAFLVFALVVGSFIIRDLASPRLPTVPRSKIPPPVLVHLANTNSTLRIFPGIGGAFLILPDGTLWRWGPAGRGNFSKALVPEQVSTNYGWIEAAVGAQQCAAIRSNGTFWSWGYDLRAFTVSSTPYYPFVNSPEQIGLEGDWKSVTAGSLHTVLLKNDGTAWAWGHDEDAQMGNGLQPAETNSLRWGISSQLPRMQTNLVQVGTNHDWVALAGEDYHTLGIRRDGTLWVWGRIHEFRSGRLYPTPTQVCRESNWVAFCDRLVLNSKHELWKPLEVAPDARAPASEICLRFATNAEPGRFALAGLYFYQLHSNGTLWATRMKYSASGGSEPVASARQVDKRSDWVSLCGIGTAFGLTADGTVWMWGSDLGQEGVMPFNVRMNQLAHRMKGWLGMNGGAPVSAYWITPMQETPRPLMRMTPPSDR